MERGCHELLGTCQPTWLFPMPLGDGNSPVKCVWELQLGLPLVTMKRNGNFEGVTQIILKQKPKLGQTNHASEVFWKLYFLPTDKAVLGNLPVLGSPDEESLPSPQLPQTPTSRGSRLAAELCWCSQGGSGNFPVLTQGSCSPPSVTAKGRVSSLHAQPHEHCTLQFIASNFGHIYKTSLMCSPNIQT